MKIEWILLAEGLGQDAKGAITAIGLNQNVLATPSLPATTKRAVVARLVGEDGGSLNSGDKVTLRFSVSDPAGHVIAAQTAQGTIGPRPWPDLPLSSDLPIELVLTFQQYGTHKFEVAVQASDGTEVNGHLDFYVVTPPKAELSTDQPAGAIPNVGEVSPS